MGDLNFVALVGGSGDRSPLLAVANTLDELAPDDVQVDVLDWIDVSPHADGDLRDGNAPDVIALAGALVRADAVVFVMPDAGHGTPDAAKSAVAWLMAFSPCPLASKPVAIQIVSAAPRCADHTRHHLSQAFRSLRAHVLEEPEVSLANIDLKVDHAAACLRDEEGRRGIRSQLAALSGLVRGHPLTPLPRDG